MNKIFDFGLEIKILNSGAATATKLGMGCHWMYFFEFGLFKIIYNESKIQLKVINFLFGYSKKAQKQMKNQLRETTSKFL